MTILFSHTAGSQSVHRVTTVVEPTAHKSSSTYLSGRSHAETAPPSSDTPDTVVIPTASTTNSPGATNFCDMSGAVGIAETPETVRIGDKPGAARIPG